MKFHRFLRLSLATVLIGGCLAGCQSLKDRSMDDLQKFRDGAVQTAQDLNATLVFQTHYTGKTGLYYNQEGGIDTGLRASATFVIIPDDNDAEKIPAP